MINTVHIILGSPENDELKFNLMDNDRVIGVDRGAVLVLNKNSRLDLAIGDFDSVTSAELQDIKARAKDFRQFQPEKDDTDAEIALKWAEDLYDPETIVIHNWTGGRMDHLLNLLFFVYQPRFEKLIEKVVFKNSINTIRFYKEGHYVLEKEEGKYYLAIIGMTALKGLTIEDVKYPVDKLDTDYPVTLVSNEIIGDTCRVSLDEGLLAVIQSEK
ncbi:thiamine diphosphokinase [Alkalibacterium olivapovliticus]|uniref:Thiamine diphosphokinase n=1 Tax=Alkalibacterium olivapovliticus TaxID=99907 RepID=A0A2T0WAV1_9LACT|nr:thiamine diphosphokinase [Alkalibacterium olivapovliticus]PRY83831.1 thiamine pyrophosphokinase [Alkalibacterium olivapovliticus]